MNLIGMSTRLTPLQHARICEKWEREKKKREEEAANKVFDDRFDEWVPPPFILNSD